MNLSQIGSSFLKLSPFEISVDLQWRKLVHMIEAAGILLKLYNINNIHETSEMSSDCLSNQCALYRENGVYPCTHYWEIFCTLILFKLILSILIIYYGIVQIYLTTFCGQMFLILFYSAESHWLCEASLH